MRSRLPAVAAVAAVGALAVLLAASQQWGSAAVTSTTAARQHVSVSGRQVSAALPALAIALLALAVAVVAARGLLRRIAALVGTAVAVVETVVAVHARGDIANALSARVFGVPANSVPADRTGWWVLAGCGGVVATVAFGAICAAGGRWQGMGARYDAPQAAARQKDPTVAAWEALDRGDDPTD